MISNSSSDSEVSDETGVGTRFLERERVLNFEGFDGVVDVDFPFDFGVEEGGQNTEDLGI